MRCSCLWLHLILLWLDGVSCGQMKFSTSMILIWFDVICGRVAVPSLLELELFLSSIHSEAEQFLSSSTFSKTEVFHFNFYAAFLIFRAAFFTCWLVYLRHFSVIEFASISSLFSLFYGNLLNFMVIAEILSPKFEMYLKINENIIGKCNFNT